MAAARWRSARFSLYDHTLRSATDSNGGLNKTCGMIQEERKIGRAYKVLILLRPAEIGEML
jgi:hypothetical protein